MVQTTRLAVISTVSNRDSLSQFVLLYVSIVWTGCCYDRVISELQNVQSVKVYTTCKRTWWDYKGETILLEEWEKHENT